MLGFFDDFGNILLAAVAVVVAFGLTERWRIEYQAKKKRERQNQRNTDGL
jgi:type II secretory pathway component PulK